MSDLTIEVLKAAIEKIEKLGPMPFFYYSMYADAIYHGPLIDEALKKINPRFDSRFHKGYIVPMKYKEQIEQLMTEKGNEND